MSESDDDYVEFGTPLDPIEDDDVPRKKPVLLEDQVVKDAQGRRRFHGAFTGGFSAGFFNTVGSLEGWTPKSFKSSRSERSESNVQKPSDFMDDEDIGEFGIAPQVLRATEDFNHLKRRRERILISDGPIPGEPVLKLLLEPIRETVGLRILRRMGWRPGQGVGPRVAPRERKRLVGCAPPPGLGSNAVPSSGSSEEDDDEAAAAGITFAPEDVPSFLVQPKTDKFGLGYKGLDRRPVLSSSGQSSAHPRRIILGGGRGGTVSVAGQAFGVGALEEEDEDIYTHEDMSQYDFALGGPASSRHKANQPSAVQAGNSLQEMFTKALRISVRDHFPPPTLPKGFVPGLKVRKTRFDQPPPGARTTSLAPVPQARSADERAALVGEESSGLGATMVAADEEDLKERERLRAEALKLTASLPPAGPAVGAGAGGQFTPFAGHPEKQRRYEQFLALRRAGQRDKLSHLQPFSMSEWERRREMTEFEQAARLFQPLSSDMGERFVSASQLDDSTDPLTPVERSMGATPEQLSAAKMKMFGSMTRSEEPWQPCDLLCKRFNIAKPAVSDVPVNARSRKKVSVFDFLKAAPHNTIQTKISDNILDPSTNLNSIENTSSSTASTTSTTTSTASTTTSTATATSTATSTTSTTSTTTTTTTTEILTTSEKVEEAGDKIAAEAELTEVQKSEVATQETENKGETPEVVQELPFPEPGEKIDLFKAIFLSSSESESEEEQKEENEQSKLDFQKDKTQYAELSHLVASASAEVPALFPEAEKRSITKTPAKSGVFANLDLDALLSHPKSATIAKSAENGTQNEKSESVSTQDDAVYGPRLPSMVSVTTNSKGKSLSSVIAPPEHSLAVSEAEWVESTSLHKKKKKKKEKRHKDKKNKSFKHKKHKHKK